MGKLQVLEVPGMNDGIATVTANHGSSLSTIVQTGRLELVGRTELAKNAELESRLSLHPSCGDRHEVVSPSPIANR
jgi:hypothetical protein